MFRIANAIGDTFGGVLDATEKVAPFCGPCLYAEFPSILGPLRRPLPKQLQNPSDVPPGSRFEC